MIWVEVTTVKLVAATVPEEHLGRPGEAGPGDGDRRAPGVGPEVGEIPVTVGRSRAHR